MPLPEWKKRIPKAQSLRDEMIANIVNMDPVVPYGPPGASAEFTHGLLKANKPLGEGPRKDTPSGNKGIAHVRNVPDERFEVGGSSVSVPPGGRRYE